MAAPQAPDAPVLVPQTGSTIKATVDAVAGAKMYCFILVLDGMFNVSIANGQLEVPVGTNAIMINSTKHSAIFKNLPAMKTVQVAVAIVNAAGVSALSTVVSSSTIV